MNEIEKMYENANITPKRCSECDNNMDCGYGKGCYPPFTAEKQLELIKWLANKFSFFAIEINFKQWSSSNGLISGFYKNSLEESIADYINSLWQDLTEEEKQQVKGILE